MRFHIVMLKTLRDLFSIRRTVFFLVLCLIIPFMFAEIAKNEAIFNFKVMNLAMQMQVIDGIFVFFSFLWLAGIPLMLLAASTCGSFISKEDEDKTLLLLVSKPIRRYEIVMGKFLAFLITSILLELLVLFATPLILYNVLAIDISVFESMLGFIPSIFAYSIFIMFVFGLISTGLSVISRSRTKVVFLLVALTILIFFVFSMVKGYAARTGIYETYYLSYFDVNYHLGNSYIMFIEQSGQRLAPSIQGMIGAFTGTYEAADPAMIYDPDLEASPPSMELKKYTPPLVSFSIWIVLSLIIFAWGLMKFQRKEIV